MNRRIVKIFVVTLSVIAFLFNACDKDDSNVVSEQDDIMNRTLVTEGETRSPIVIDGVKQEWTFPARNKSLSKGILFDESTYYPYIENSLKIDYGSDYQLIDTVDFEYHGINYSMRVLRVDRRSEPGKYFYVMIDNLKVQLDTACWAYADNENNVSTYGRLYTWHAANALAPLITMQLPVYSENNPTVPLLDGFKLTVQAKILSRQDVCDIIERDSIGHMPYNGYSIDNNNNAPTHGMTSPLPLPLYYYDVFVGGLEGSGYTDYTRGLHTLGGFRNTMYQSSHYVNGWYDDLNTAAFIWLRDKYMPSLFNDPFHFPLEIDYDAENKYTAFINAEHWDQYGFSVRYVFEPRYL